ncbi:WhiB family transcriptional regulator, partial [Corynebacterium sp. A21]|uniref:WhiB family transcriptional regulator n=1 Tax=Corynebacterium sp. A21 TaxID=3457318 RepID=UPI003FD3F5EF
VRTQCLVTALDSREEFGVWGGLTERQRRAVLRDNPHVENWAHHLAAGGELTGIRQAP